MSRGAGGRSRRACLPLDGVLLLDKPVGYTSNQALQAAKRLLNACKAGHTGSLDPIATGLLPLCFGEATKLSQFLIDADKRYWAVFRLGVTTTTHDAEGEIVATRPVSLRRAEVEAALRAFVGEIDQVPPMYSAIKLAGRPLYELARAGVEVDRAPRRVTIRGIHLLALEGERLELEIDCSKGTYIRSLAHDLGERLGCGAHVAELRRLGVGGLTVERAVTLADLEALPDAEARARRLLPPDDVLTTIPEVRLTALATHYLCQGQPVSARHGFAPGWVRLYDDAHHFLGIGQVLDDGRVAPRRLMLRRP
jgi:tRNA pseudouridine55 synthase